LAQLFIVAFVTGVLTVFFDVAYQSYLPALIKREELTDGNAKLTSTQQIASVAGPALGGALVSAVGAATAIAADAASYVISVVSLVFIHKEDVKPEVRGGPIVHNLVEDVREGLHFVFGQPMLRNIAGCTGTANLCTDMSSAVLTVYMVRELHLSPAKIGLLFAIGGIAGVVGALLTNRAITRLGVGWSVIVGAVGASVAGFGLPLATPGHGVWWIAASMGTFWLFCVLYNVAQVSLRQALTPPRLQGRMNATMRFLVWGTMPIGALLGGALGASIGLRPTLWVAAAVGVIPPLFVVFSPVRRQKTIPTDHIEANIEPSAVGPVVEPSS
jgi:predicted MFS family arabinose efflux permease